MADHDTCEGCRRKDIKARELRDSPGYHDGAYVGLYREES